MQKYFDLYLKYFPTEKGAEENFAHTSMVLAIAKQIAMEKNLNVDWSIAEPGILLHDIAVYQCEEAYKPKVAFPYIQHALLGSLIVRAEGFDEKVALMVERHIGSGISKEEIAESHYPLPRRDFLPTSLEEKLLCFSDKLHSDTKGLVTFEKRLEQYRKFGEGPVSRLIALKDKFGLPDLSKLTA